MWWRRRNGGPPASAQADGDGPAGSPRGSGHDARAAGHAPERPAEDPPAVPALAAEELAVAARRAGLEVAAPAPAHTVQVPVRRVDAGPESGREQLVTAGGALIVSPAPNLDPDSRAELHGAAVQLVIAAGVDGPATVVLSHGEGRGPTWRAVAVRPGGASPCADGTEAGPAHTVALEVRTGASSGHRPVTVYGGSGPGVEVLRYPLGRAPGAVLGLRAGGPTRAVALARARRALRGCYVHGAPTNRDQLLRLLDGIDGRTPEPQDQEAPELGTSVLRYIADVTVNGHPELRDRPACARGRAPDPPPAATPPAGMRERLVGLGPERFAAWMRDEHRLLVTDTTMRDAHQSLLATRMRTRDIVAAAPAYAAGLPELLSLECWGGASFDVAMRFLREDPWERLAQLRAAAPNLPLQMLLRGDNAVGYSTYSPTVVRFFIDQAARAGIDIFRIFDSLNLVDRMRVAIAAVREAGALCEGAICYTADIDDPTRPRYSLSYYVELAEELERAGCHVLAIKDMAGLCRPVAARKLVGALREAVGMPVRLHTHDTSGFAAATLFAAVEAGVDAVDCATDALSGLTSQPNLGSLVRALEFHDRATGLNPDAITRISGYWEQVRRMYAPFESDIRAGTSDVYRHEMPGGQYTNLREQARGLGLKEERWPEVADAYAAANRLLGDIVKVTPSSKVVGDLALAMVSAGMDAGAVLHRERGFAFPASVLGLLRGEIGVPPGGFPTGITARALGERSPSAGLDPAPPAAAAVDAQALDALRADLDRDWDAASRLMYPRVYDEFAAGRARDDDLSGLATDVFFGGLEPGEETTVITRDGRRVVVVCQRLGKPREDGSRSVTFSVDGVPQRVVVRVASKEPMHDGHHLERRKAGEGETGVIGAPVAGTVVGVHTAPGSAVSPGDVLLTIEAMKMEVAVEAPIPGTVDELLVAAQDRVGSADVLLTLTPA